MCAESSNLEIIDETSVKDTEALLQSSDILEQKVVYIGGFLSHKFNQPDVDMSEDVTCEFLEELRPGRLHIPILKTVYFVHNAIHLYEHLNDSRKNCSKYFQHLLSHIDTAFSENIAACRTLSNMIFKAHVLAASDHENMLECLR